MSLMRGALNALGTDYLQWRGMVGPLIKVGFRTAQTTVQITQQGKKPRLVSWLMRVVMGLAGVFLALLATILPGLFPLSLVVLTAAGLVVFFLLLQNFQAVAVSPMDYDVLGHRPVSPRTYLVTRLTVTLAHQGIVAGLLVVPSVVVCGIRFGWLPAAGLALAAVLLVLSVALGLIGLYGSLIKRVGGQRLTRALNYLQLCLAFLYVVPLLLQDSSGAPFAGIRDLAPGGWTMALPTAWFAGFVGLLSGGTFPGEWLGLLGTLATVCALAWFARDKLSLASAEKLGAVLDAQAKTRAGRTVKRRAGWLARRLSVAATLIRGQFRHDTKFRMGVIAMFPLLIFYLLMSLRISGSVDPFVPGAETWSLFGVHFAVLIAPSLLLAQLYVSESYRAGWIFFAAPVDRARLAADARHCVTVFFFLPFLAIAAVSFAWLFHAVWHGLVHAIFLGGLGILAMQVSQYLFPMLPFTVPVNRKRNGFLVGAIMLCLGVLSGLLGPYASFAWPRPAWAVGSFAVVLLLLVLMEWILPGRLNRKLRWLESEG